jgi:AraC family transcriptional regulator
MSERATPVSLGSPRFNTIECGSFLLTEAFFPPGQTIERHYHDRAVVGLTLEGEWDSVLNTIRLRNSAGSLHVEPAGDSHTNYFTSTTHVAIIQPDPIDGRLAQPFGRLLTTGCQQQIGLPGILVAERMCRELRSPDDLTPLAIESLSLDLLTSYIRARRSRMGSAPSWLSRTVDYMHAHFLDQPGLEELAHVAGVTPEHLGREFRQRYRMGPAQYIRRLRLESAAQHLRNSTDSLVMIASSSGFADQSHFTRHFRRLFGTTPAAFRKASRRS